MSKKIKTEKEKERNKKAQERMKRFEKNQIVEKDKNVSTIRTAYQKKENGEWELIEIPF